MALRIRLARHGAKKHPFYRIVVANSEAKRDGRFIDIIGTYDPNRNPAAIAIKQELLEQWQSRGAKPTATVASLLKKAQAVG
ncbi:MAG: 30S ribosomal protein S16 [Deltaproteobacteria bacterium]|nr:30S ribosomal protein S16 [Deltaproteobacteria bacterium]